MRQKQSGSGLVQYQTLQKQKQKQKNLTSTEHIYKKDISASNQVEKYIGFSGSRPPTLFFTPNQSSLPFVFLHDSLDPRHLKQMISPIKKNIATFMLLQVYKKARDHMILFLTTFPHEIPYTMIGYTIIGFDCFFFLGRSLL